jgi:Xaa-Pro aminopeptidase
MGPGKTDEDVRRAALPIKEKGFWTFDALVHGWGLSIEPPRLDLLEIALIKRPQEPIVFKPGMCMVVQPHVLTADKRRGLQLGSLVLITETGAEALQTYPMKFVEI